MARDAVLYAVLGMIAGRPDGIHGYQIKSELDGELWALKHGQVYRLLERLKAERLVEGFDQPQAGRPSRRVFRITPLGARALERWFLRPPTEEPPPLHDELSLKILLFGEERVEGTLSLIRDQRARGLRRLARLTKRRTLLADDRPVAELLLRRADMQLRSEIAWLEVAEEAIAKSIGTPVEATGA
jgi:PadR family transcriptional regulator, regulatory protein AphA